MVDIDALLAQTAGLSKKKKSTTSSKSVDVYIHRHRPIKNGGIARYPNYYIVDLYRPTELPTFKPENGSVFLHSHDVMAPCRKSLWCHELGYNPTGDEGPIKDTEFYYARIAEFNAIWDYLYNPLEVPDIKIDLRLE